MAKTVKLPTAAIRAAAKRARSYDDYLADEFHELRRQFDSLKQDMNYQNTEIRNIINTQNNELRKEIQNIKDLFNTWKSNNDHQLEILNIEKKKAVEAIDDHEIRITDLEQKIKTHEIEGSVWSKVKRYSFKTLINIFWFGVVISAAYGIKPAMQLLNLFN